VSKGYQAGGFLVVVYKPQSLWSYEAGLKSQWFDRRLQLNANVFRSEITDMQIFLQNIVGTRMENAGKAHVNGFELETIAVPVDGLTLNMEVSLMDAVYDSYFAFDNRTAAIAPVLEDNKGNRLNYTPKYTVNMGAEYALQTDIGTFTPRVDVFFSGDLYFAGANKALDRQSAYTFINLSLGYVEPKGVWTVDAFVHNLADKDVISNQTHSSSSNGLGIQINQNVYYPPRTVGVRFGVNF
jgi:iron complex outermembrane receptor protein